MQDLGWAQGLLGQELASAVLVDMASCSRPAAKSNAVQEPGCSRQSCSICSKQTSLHGKSLAGFADQLANCKSKDLLIRS